MDRPKIVAITAGGPYPWVIFNALSEHFGPITVIEENPESKAEMLKRRARKVGYVNTAGQLATMVASRLGKRFATKRDAQIIDEFELQTAPGADQRIISVSSANDAECTRIIAEEKPDVIVLVGCRMLRPKTLAAIHAPIINYHAGINPKYRGMMGGYWALVNNDVENFGTTVHRVDEGVDTGAVLYQARMTPSPADTIATYAMIMAAHSRQICIRAVADILQGKQKIVTVNLPSKQWYYPPVWFYIRTGIMRGIW